MKKDMNEDLGSSLGSPVAGEVGKDQKPQLPTEPGLYWASCYAEDQYDSVLAIYGEAPFLKKQTVVLPIIVYDGVPLCSIGLERVRVVGPRVVIPSLGDR